jgi:hypothetical protein
MSYQNKILYKNFLLEENKEFIIYKNNFIDNNIIQLKDKIEELNNKLDFINNNEITLDNKLGNNINKSIIILENTITLINRFIISKGNIDKYN